MTKNRHHNQLIHSSSPYLLQHAHNPVHWFPWNEDVLNKARDEDKLIIVSIGYSACHWCHVMAHECFEDEEVAAFMNDHFICIKVDREERPDVDHFFMTAVQLTGVQGGWPLNVIALPDGQPFWGGTYFPKTQWLEILQKIQHLFKAERDKVTHHAHNLTTGVQQASIINTDQGTDPDYSEIINHAMEAWSPQWDMQWGGSRGHPKFPMPANLNFLLHLHYHHPQTSFSDFLQTTLDKMARGGIYDQVGGGFARYSVDEFWKVPHFEKMLYDNAQLIELYADAYAMFQKEEYRDVVFESIRFVEREMMHPSGAFFSALDADSEGGEGKYYVWTEDEIAELTGKDFPVFADYYNINESGYWENGNYILMRLQNDNDFATSHHLTTDELRQKVANWKNKLYNRRKNRTRPGLDDKTVTSWNALMTKALTKAYKIFGEEEFKSLALKNGTFILNELISSRGSIYHTWKDGQPGVSGFLEDYATSISAFIALYEISGHEDWIKQALALAKYTENHFYDEETGHFWFMEKSQKELPSNHFETQDNVIPSASSVLARALMKLSMFTGIQNYRQKAQYMLRTMLPHFRKYPWGYANWGSLMLFSQKPGYEVVVTGPDAKDITKKLQQKYRPNVIWAPLLLESEGNLELVKARKSKDKNTIYICSGGSCQLPVHTPEEAEKQIAPV